MQELGLESIRENAKCNYKKQQEYQKRNLLNQGFSVQRVNEVWVSDILISKSRTMGSICALLLICSPAEWWATVFPNEAAPIW